MSSTPRPFYRSKDSKGDESVLLSERRLHVPYSHSKVIEQHSHLAFIQRELADDRASQGALLSSSSLGSGIEICFVFPEADRISIVSVIVR